MGHVLTSKFMKRSMAGFAAGMFYAFVAANYERHTAPSASEDVLHNSNVFFVAAGGKKRSYAGVRSLKHKDQKLIISGGNKKGTPIWIRRL